MTAPAATERAETQPAAAQQASPPSATDQAAQPIPAAATQPATADQAAAGLAPPPAERAVDEAAEWRRRAMQADLPLAERIAAMQQLTLQPDRVTFDVLAGLLGDPDPALAEAALAAFETAVAASFDADIEAAQQWWQTERAHPDAEFWRRHAERLHARNERLATRLDDALARLARVLEANFLRAGDAERVTLLKAYLADANPIIRELGLRLTQLHLSQGRALDTLPEEVRVGVRALTRSKDPQERTQAIRTVASFRQPVDAAMFIELLEDERHPAARRALINGLGYVGDGDATRTLLTLLNKTDGAAQTEVVTALGRLAERGAMKAELRPLVVPALLDVFGNTQRDEVALRERLVWAMSNIGDADFTPALADALDPNEALAVRQTAIRGAETLRTPGLADAVARAVKDEDASIRQAAITLLPAVSPETNAAHLEALWTRLQPEAEPEERLRLLAWRQVPRMLARHPIDNLDAWLAKVPGEGVARQRRALELLAALIEAARAGDEPDHAREGHLLARTARTHGALLDPQAATAAYIEAIDNLIKGRQSKVAAALRGPLLRSALVSGKYDAAVADKIRAVEVELDVDALWAAVKPEIVARLTPEAAPRALAMLDRLQAHAPAPWPEPILNDMQSLQTRAAAIPDRSAPPTDTQPADDET